MRVLLRRPTPVALPATSAVIGDLAQPRNMAAALEGVDAVIHSAGLAHRMSGRPEDDYRVLNTEATIALARAAQRAGVKRFVFLSSIRAQCGSSSDAVLTEALPPAPTDAYGRSKLAAERGLAELDLDWVALRLAVVYGAGAKGNVAQLMRFARSPLPLPLGAFKGRRSLLALDNLAAAIDLVLRVPDPLRRVLIAADPQALTVAEIIAVLRQGLDRRPRVFWLPPRLVELLLRVAGRHDAYTLLSGSLVADCSALQRLGWTPPVETLAALAGLMHANANRVDA
jgi:UDP-glucose 4-epimerase